MLNDILDFSKIEAGQLEMAPEPFRTRDMVAEACRMFEYEAQQKELDLSWSVADDVPDSLLADQYRIRQVLANLLGNAMKFTSAGGVKVSVAFQGEPAAGPMLHFVVSDTGIGIPADKLEIIFAAFRQVDGSTSRRYGGTGLGLAISQKLVELMGGRIWARSNAGQGTEFHFTLRCETTDTPVEPAASKPGAGQLRSVTGLRVLLAEDNVINQRVAQRLLEKAGHSVVVAENGKRALERLAEEKFDVVLMDVQMPEMDGFEAVGRIRKAEKGTARHQLVVAMTAHAMRGDRERCLEAGMDGYVAKPFDPAALHELLATLAVGGS